jgi:N4-gp56 family major capsid protein
MAIDNFIPQIWSARLLASLKKSLVYGQTGIVNRDYEGEIKEKGNTVKISSIGAVTVSDHSKNTDLTAPEALNDAQQVLVIEKAKYFNFQVDDVDRVQGTPAVMDQAMVEAAYALADQTDQYIAGLYTEALAANLLGTTGSPTSIATAAAAYEALVDLGVLLTQSNIPTQGRWAIVPPWFYGRLLKDDRFVRAGTVATDQVLRNGQIGEAAGFSVMQSNNVPNDGAGAKYRVIAGHPMAISFAEQVSKVEAYRPERRFADAVKGLHLYGAKLVRNQAIAVGTFNKT